MTSFDIYVFFLCFVVFSLFTALFSVLLSYIVKFYIKLVKLGAEDENIKIEYENTVKLEKKRGNKVVGCISTVLNIAIVSVMFIAFAFSVFLNVTTGNQVGDIPALKVVKSDSMSYKNVNNEYLFENELDDQVNTFDLIVLHNLPEEEKLNLYDIVAYERDGDLILHRIVGIEEPNEDHQDKRYFLLQGDAIEYHDRFPVLYEEMRGIYYGDKIPFVGSFFSFMQSPAGYLCIILIFFAMIVTPIVNRKIVEVKKERRELIFASRFSEGSETEETNK